MKDNIISNPTLTYERYTTFAENLDELSKQRQVNIDTGDLYEQLRPTYFPSSHGMIESHVKEWVAQDAIVLVISIIVHDLINRGSRKGPLDIEVSTIEFTTATRSWKFKTKGDVIIYIDSCNLNEIHVDTDILPKALVLFDNLTTITLADILSDINNIMIELMLGYKPVTPQQAIIHAIDKLRDSVKENNDVEYLGGVVHLGIEHLTEVLKAINRENEK